MKNTNDSKIIALLKAQIFLWSHDSKIIISDIDGTITSSPVLGLIPLLGANWI